MATAPTPITTGPAVPDSSSSEASFDAAYEAFNTWERNELVPGANALASNVYANAVIAEAKAGEATAGAVSASDSAARAESAAGVAGAVAWVSGATYAAGNVAYSPINFQNYRRKTNGAGTIDPSLDAANWAIVGIDPATIYPFSNDELLEQSFAISLYF